MAITGNPLNPDDTSIFASKSNTQVFVGLGLIVALFLISAAVQAIWKINIFELYAAALTAISSHTIGAIYRNVKTDTPIRIMQAQQQFGVPPPEAYGKPPAIKVDVN